VPDQQPRLKLTFTGAGFANGAVPLSVVASKLQALQQAVFHAAAAAAGHQGERRGLWYNRYRSAADLTFADAHHSDLVIEAELAANPVLHDEFDIGRKAVDLLFDAAVAVQNDNIASVKLRPYDRDYLLRAIEGLMPNIGDQYQVKLENCRPETHPTVTFNSESRLKVKGYTARVEQTFDSDDPSVVVGELIKIHVDTGEDKITIRSRQRDIDCFYGNPLRDQVANLIAGSIVEVTGFATLGEGLQISRLHQMLTVETVSMEPLRIARFEYGGRAFSLNTPIAVNIEYTSDGLWVYHYPELNLWGYASRREDALTDLHQSFRYIYEQIAEEEAANLDSVAQLLRERLLRLVVNQGDAAHA
jgi:hypothetical protein